MSYSPIDQYYRKTVGNPDPRGTTTYTQSIPSSNPVSLPGQDYAVNPLNLSHNVKIIPSDDPSNRKYNLVLI